MGWIVFAGVYGRVIPSLAFFSPALIDTAQQTPFSVRIEQVVCTAAEKAASQAKTAAKKAPKPVEPRKPGCPKGSKNKPATDLILSPELLRIQTRLQAQLEHGPADPRAIWSWMAILATFRLKWCSSAACS